MKRNNLPTGIKFRFVFESGFWLMLAFLMTIIFVFIWLFPFDRFQSELLGEGSQEIKGKITAIEEDGYDEDDNPIFLYYYTFASPELGEWSGASTGDDPFINVGDEVSIYYDPDYPAISKVIGMSSFDGGFTLILVALLFVVFFLIGIIYTPLENLHKWKLITTAEILSGEVLREYEELDDKKKLQMIEIGWDFNEASYSREMMRKIYKSNLQDPVKVFVNAKKPRFSIILGTLPLFLQKALKDE